MNKETIRRESAPSNRSHGAARQRGTATPQRGFMVKAGDVTIKGDTVEDCRELASIAKDIRETEPAKMRIPGGFGIEGSMRNIYILTGIGAVGLVSWACYKEYSKRKDYERRNHATEQHLPNTDTPPTQSETLNETIGKQLSNMPGSKDLCGGLIRRGGINLIFSPTGEGKSILAMQMAIEMASGQPTKLVKDADQPRQSVTTLVYDEEQDEEDILERYGKMGYMYPDNLRRFESCWFDDEAALLDDIAKQCTSRAIELCIIIDNITSIIPALSSNKTRKFYKRLKQIQKEAKGLGYRITFIVVAHTIKGYDSNITLKDLAGNANISNFLNRCIAIVPTKLGEKIKMLTVLKNRDSLKGDATVIKLEEDPYLHFEYMSTNPIKDAVTTETMEEMEKFFNAGSLLEYPHSNNNLPKDKLRGKVFDLKRKGLNGKEIAGKLGISEMKVSRILNHKGKGQRKHN